ncbi:MAG TPA: isochorismate synthase [Ktedonobacteraceae bacterium]|nr:isochorismate synthase [Ktedonobacteraceae bacterium]
MNTTTLHAIPRLWPVPCGKEQLGTLLRKTLRAAADRSARSGRAVLASITLPVERIDAIQVFAGSRLAGFGTRFFWERPSEQTAFVGIGAAARIETHGASHFASAAAAWRALLDDAVIDTLPNAFPLPGGGPVAFGGFAFDPLSLHTPLWEGFPDGLLTLPRLLLSYAAEEATLTINRQVQASDDSEYEAEQVADDLARLWAGVGQPSLWQETTGGSNALTTQDLLPLSEWMQQVAETVKLIRQGIYEKVVLARGLRVTSESPFDIGAVLHRLRQEYPGASIFAIQRGQRLFVGATPERLVRVQDRHIQTMALAGSAARGASEEEDRQLGEDLLRSEKNKIEHIIVVERVREALTTLCARVSVAEMPRLLRLKNIQHLETPIVGELLPGKSILETLGALHPTPAVGGLPGPEALERIRECEQLDRGWYAGPVGWVDADGNGEFAVALRSALLEGRQATLFAGCGIVADSDPQSEYAESCLKFQAMLRGLGSED